MQGHHQGIVGCLLHANQLNRGTLVLQTVPMRRCCRCCIDAGQPRLTDHLQPVGDLTQIDPCTARWTFMGGEPRGHPAARPTGLPHRLGTLLPGWLTGCYQIRQQLALFRLGETPPQQETRPHLFLPVGHGDLFHHPCQLNARLVHQVHTTAVTVRFRRHHGLRARFAPDG